MKYLVRKSVVYVVGRIWMPPVVCGQTRVLSAYDVENARDENGVITRDSVEHWVHLHCGDFQEIIDFSFSIEDGADTVESDWATVAGELVFCGLVEDSE